MNIINNNKNKLYHQILIVIIMKIKNFYHLNKLIMNKINHFLKKILKVNNLK